LGGSKIEQFLTHLAAKKKVAVSTQNQALSALLFLYREVLDLPLDLTFQSFQARRPKHLDPCAVLGAGYTHNTAEDGGLSLYH